MTSATLQDQIRDNEIMRAMTDECPDCKGRGYTRNTETVMLPGNQFKPPLPTKKLRTFKQGSGCARCHGTGRIER